MSEQQWTEVDDYITDRLLPPDPVLDAALAASSAAGLPPIAVTPAQGRLLQLIAQMCGARRILEVGTLGGYSTIWLARALPAGGELVTLEIEPRHAEVARANLERADLADRVDVRVGRGVDLLRELDGPYDLVFIDADKPSNVDYVTEALRLTRPGSVIVVDNVVRGGKVVDPDSPDPNVEGVRRTYDLLAAEPRLKATAIQTVGSKGYDGFVLAVVGP